MIDQILREFVNLIYGVKRVKRKFELNNSDEIVLVADACKGFMATSDQNIKRGSHWATAQRAVILLTNRQIVCGKWTIPLDTITNAQLLEISSLFLKSQVLKIQTSDNKHYQFGMQISPEWTKQTNFPLVLEKGKLSHSVYSIVLRLILIICLINWLYDVLS
jgi:hypothetical protein